ncbi:MAG: hypothetical protein ACYDEP_02600 [Acidimicrobiales bacterium]
MNVGTYGKISAVGIPFLIVSVIMALIAAVAIIALIAVLAAFFFILGYIWIPSAILIGVFAVGNYKGRWIIAVLYPVCTGLIMWAYGWPMFAIVGLALVQSAVWLAISIPMTQRRARLDRKRLALGRY